MFPSKRNIQRNGFGSSHPLNPPPFCARKPILHNRITISGKMDAPTVFGWTGIFTVTVFLLYPNALTVVKWVYGFDFNSEVICALHKFHPIQITTLFVVIALVQLLVIFLLSGDLMVRYSGGRFVRRQVFGLPFASPRNRGLADGDGVLLAYYVFYVGSTLIINGRFFFTLLIAMRNECYSFVAVTANAIKDQAISHMR